MYFVDCLVVPILYEGKLIVYYFQWENRMHLFHRFLRDRKFEPAGGANFPYRLKASELPDSRVVGCYCQYQAT